MLHVLSAGSAGHKTKPQPPRGLGYLAGCIYSRAALCLQPGWGGSGSGCCPPWQVPQKNSLAPVIAFRLVISWAFSKRGAHPARKEKAKEKTQSPSSLTCSPCFLILCLQRRSYMDIPSSTCCVACEKLHELQIGPMEGKEKGGNALETSLLAQPKLSKGSMNKI